MILISAILVFDSKVKGQLSFSNITTITCPFSSSPLNTINLTFVPATSECIFPSWNIVFYLFDNIVVNNPPDYFVFHFLGAFTFSGFATVNASINEVTTYYMNVSCMLLLLFMLYYYIDYFTYKQRAERYGYQQEMYKHHS